MSSASPAPIRMAVIFPMSLCLLLSFSGQFSKQYLSDLEVDK